MTLVAVDVSMQVVRLLHPIVQQIKKHDAQLADQLKRAASSAAANLCEGERREGGNKRRAYEIAHGEAREALGWLDIAAGWGYALDTTEVRRVMDRLLGLCWGLTHPRPVAKPPQEPELAIEELP